MTGLLLSAYPAAPDEREFGVGAIDHYYSGLRTIPEPGSIELPVAADGSLLGGTDTLARVPPTWDIILTTIPGTRAGLDRNPEFGLASTSRLGREEAVEFMLAVQKTASRIDRVLGRRAVSGIVAVSAPPAFPDPNASSGAFLAESLIRVLDADADDRAIYLEHCDSPVSGRRPVKGYLGMSDEVDALSQVRAAGYRNIGALVNWGRSAIEQRSVNGPVDHLRLARAAGVLRGLVFSGCSDADGRYGHAWSDAHPPPAPDPGYPSGEVTSLLTNAEIRRCLAVLPPETLIGVKVAARPDLDVAQRVQLQRDTLGYLRTAVDASQPTTDIEGEAC